MKFSNLTSFNLIELLESATELFRNKKYHTREHVEKYLGLSIHRSSFYGYNDKGKLKALDVKKTVFDSDSDVELVIEGILQLDTLPTNTGAGNIVYTGYGVLEIDGVVIYDGRGGASGPSVFNADIPVVLSGGKTVGRFTNGQTIPSTGLTAEEVVTLISTEYLIPTFTSFSMGLASTVEVGTILTGFTNVTWSTSNSGNIVPDTIQIDDVTGVTTLVQNIANDGSESIDLQGPIQKIIEGSNTWRIATLDTQNNAALRNVSTSWQYLQFYGVGTVPIDSANVRALGNQRFNSAGNNFTLNTGSVENIFVVALPLGKSISSVIDLDALNADITSEYVNTGSINVTIGGGEILSYDIYIMNPAIPYSSTHRHSITLN